MAISITYWANYTRDMPKLVKKSEMAVAADHILQFQYEADLDYIHGAVQASMKNKTYKVQAQLGGEGILNSSCQCPMGMSKCHHVAALLLYGYKSVSKTDVKCSWLKRPKTAPPKTIETIAEQYPLPPAKQSYRALTNPVTDEDLEYLYQEFTKLGRYTALHWILSPEPQPVPCPVPLVEDLLLSRDYLETATPMVWLRKQLLVGPEIREQVPNMTTGQRDNALWAAIRRLRFTASNFGLLLKAVKRGNIISMSLKKRLLSAYNLDNVQSIQWGITHEDYAIAQYTKYGAAVHKTGLWLHESGVLGASPDGLVTTPPSSPSLPLHYQTSSASALVPQLLEVKCPFSAKDHTLVDAAINRKDFFLGCKEEKLFLKPEHSYWHQVQGQLHITGADCCDLVVWTSCDMQVIRIAKESSWQTHFSGLIDLYFNAFIKSI